MRLIKKGREPSALTTYREGGGRYDGDSAFPPVKSAIRAALVAEQGGVCCYCVGRIVADDSMKIEHRVPQSSPRGSGLDLRWSNMLGACNGAQGQPRERQHCDTRKGDAEIALDPTDPSCVAQIAILPVSARVCSTSPALQREIDEVLNLNDEVLIERRKRAVDGFIQAVLRSRPGRVDRTVSDEVWLRALPRFESSDVPPPRLEPDCTAIVSWIRHRAGAITR